MSGTLLRMNEPEVVQKVHRFLATQGLDSGPVTRLFTDPHPTLTGFRSLQPFQRFALDYGNFDVHPDLVAQEADSESLIAVEAKGDADVLKGLFQAELYQNGVQRSFLAAPQEALSDSLLDLARQRGVGVLGVREKVDVLYLPEARRPLSRLYNALLADMGSAAWVSDGGTFTFNLPTHYLVWTIALLPGMDYLLQDARECLVRYPIPNDWRAALRGAAKLGLVVHSGNQVRLTDIGAAVRDLLPAGVDDWAALHQRLVSQRGATLYDLHRQAAAGLRLLLLQDPVARLVMEGLHRLGPRGGNFIELAEACAAHDRRRAQIFFLKPEASPRCVQRDSGVDWPNVAAEDFRSTTFFQYKSILKHSGLLAPTTLGAASAHRYDPTRDLWVAREFL